MCLLKYKRIQSIFQSICNINKRKTFKLHAQREKNIGTNQYTSYSFNIINLFLLFHLLMNFMVPSSNITHLPNKVQNYKPFNLVQLFNCFIGILKFQLILTYFLTYNAHSFLFSFNNII